MRSLLKLKIIPEISKRFVMEKIILMEVNQELSNAGYLINF